MINCEINFQAILVFPNQELKGTVAIGSDKVCVIEYITVEVIGCAECNFTFDKCVMKCLRIYKKGVKFQGTEEYSVAQHTITGGTSMFLVSDERHYFNFQFYIPEYLPSTWCGKFGTIKYVTSVTVKEENAAPHNFKKDLQINTCRNLCLENRLLAEVSRKVNRKFRYGFVNLGDVEVEIWLPLSGVAAGQRFPVYCSINNQSKVFFGGLIFVLTQIQIYKSTTPAKAVKLFRKDVCRVARMVDILEGQQEFFGVLETDNDTYPTNQYYRASCCQVIYEVWLSIQGSVPRYKQFGYPNIDTPGIPIIIGNVPLYKWDINEITTKVRGSMYEPPMCIETDALPPDDEVEKILNAEEELDSETLWNIRRQLVGDALHANQNKH